MKKILAAVVCIAAFVTALPIINGILMQQGVNTVFDNMNTLYKDTGTDYSVEIINYDRGLFSSRIEWKISLGKLKTLYGIDEILISDSAKHGFTGVVSTTSLEKNQWFTSFLSEQLQGKNPVQINTRYSLFGKIETTCLLDEFTFTVEEETVTVARGEFIVATDRDLKQFTSTGDWHGFSVADKLQFGRMTMDSDLEMISTFLWDGKASYDIEKLVITESGVNIALNGFTGNYILNTDMKANIMSAETTFALDSIDSQENSVDGAKARIAINNMNASAYEEFMKQYVEIVSTTIGVIAESEGTPDEEVVKQQMTTAGLQMVAVFEKLLSKGLEIEISDVLVKLKEGDIKADITLRLLKDMTLMQFAPVVGQPDLLLGIVSLQSDISMPAVLVGENPMLFAPPFPGMQTGIFIKDGEMITHTAKTKDGKLYINDQEVDLTAMQ